MLGASEGKLVVGRKESVCREEGKDSDVRWLVYRLWEFFEKHVFLFSAEVSEGEGKGDMRGNGIEKICGDRRKEGKMS